MLEQDKEWVKKIAEIRNAIQHPEKEQRIEIKNLTLMPGNKFSTPAWKYDLTKKNIGKQSDWTDLVHDFNVYLYNILTFFEELLILSLKDKFLKNSFLDIYKKNEKDILKECPMVYEVNKR